MSNPPGPASCLADKPLKCEQCETSFETSEELAQHNREEHGM
jgi:hypothetical protein